MKPKKTKEQIRKKRTEARRQRGEAAFWMYYSMGPERSLEKLRDMCAKLGLVRGINCYKNYSADFDWQNKIREVDTQLKEDRDRQQISKIEDMNESQAKDARNMRTIARAGMLFLSKAVDREKGLSLQPADIVRFMSEGTKIERLAMGEATERFEAMIFVYNVMIQAVIQVFEGINTIKNEAERDKFFRAGVDDLIHTKLIEYGDHQTN